jgi:two-component system, chemotaxis family, sensor kinase CheA
VVQYRGEIMPILDLASVLGLGVASHGEGTVDVVVQGGAGHHVGIVVGKIVDIVEERLELRPGSARYGVIGSAVLDGRVTDIVDLQAILPTTTEVAR